MQHTEVKSSNINEMSHVMSNENRHPDKLRDKPPPPSQKPSNPLKSIPSVFIIGDRMIKKVDRYFLTSSPFPTAKTIDIYDYLKPTQKDFKAQTFVLHVATNGLPLNKPPKKIFEVNVTLAESMKTDNNKIIISGIVCRADNFEENVDEVNDHLEEICAERR